MHAQPSTRFYFLLLVAMVSWGFAWPSGKLVAGVLHPNVIIFWRFFATGLSLVPVVILMKKDFRLMGVRSIWAVTFGAILYTVYNQFFLLGLEKGLAGSGGVLVTTLNPILTYLIVNSWTKTKFTRREVLGLLLGMIGGLVLLRIWDMSWENLFQTGNVFFLLGSLTWAFLSMNSHSTGEKVSPIVYAFYVNSIGALISFFLAWNYNPGSALAQDGNFWFQIFYLAIVSTTFGTTVYFFASTRLGSRTASSFIFLVPVTALIGSWVFLGEIPQIATLIGGAFAIGAVYLLNQRSQK